MRPLVLATVIVALAGFIAGAYGPFSAGASQLVELRFLPPSDPDGTNTRLTRLSSSFPRVRILPEEYT
jgi:hypothetical protein